MSRAGGKRSGLARHGAIALLVVASLLAGLPPAVAANRGSTPPAPATTAHPAWVALPNPVARRPRPTQSERAPLAVRPVDWMRPGVKRAGAGEGRAAPVRLAFRQRVLFSNFTSAQLGKVTEDLEEAMASGGHEGTDAAEVKYMLATMLMQNRPTRASLGRAQALIAQARRDGLPDDVLDAAAETEATIGDMLAPQRTATTIARVNWGVYNKCPLCCTGCYNVFNDDVLPLAKAKVVLGKLKRAGVQELVVSGGDPLLWDDLIPFVEHAHALGLKVGIDTVSYNLTRETARKLKGKVSYIGIPVDGSSQEVVEGFRHGKRDLLAKVHDSLSILDEVGIPAKVNTTVNTANVRDLKGIASSLRRHASVKDWSVFQWWSLRAPEKMQAEMKVDDATFETETAALRHAFPDLPIAPKSVGDRARTHFFVSSNGEVYTFGDTNTISTIILGDLKTQSVEQILASPALRKDSPKFEPVRRFHRGEASSAGPDHGAPAAP